MVASAFQSVPYPVFIVEQTGQVVFCNRRAQRLLWNRAEDVGPPENQHLSDLCTWEFDEIPNRIMRGAASGSLTIPLVFGTPAPRVTPTRFRACILRSDVPGQMLIMLTQDILTTATKALTQLNSQSQQARAREKELKQQAETLATNLAQMETFTQAASHDIRGPLGNLKTLIEMFSSKFGHALPNEAARYLDVILRGTQQLNGVSDGLLNHALAGASELRTEPVDLERTLADVLLLHKADIDAAEAKFEIDLCDVAIVCEPTLIHSLLSNLVSNALKYRDPARQLRVTLCTYVENGTLKLSVKDTGIGFERSQSERMFKPFQRLTSHQPGYGLGLATCAEICKRHGWKISANGQPGVGAEFTIQITEPVA